MRQQIGEPDASDELRMLHETLGHQLYKHTTTRSYQQGCMFWTVVAPPNNEAAAVGRDHGIGFVEYEP